MAEKGKLCVAAVQMECLVGEVEANLQAAESMLSEAAAGGAELVLLPELFACGCSFAGTIWKYAEPAGGATCERMRAAAAKLKVYVGFTFLEAADSEVYNTFMLISPDGTEWKCRKTQPGPLEAFVIQRAPFSSVLRTPIGVFGVQIGTDTLLRQYHHDTVERLRHLADGRHDLDLVLSPSASAAPQAGLGWKEERAEKGNRLFENVPSHQARIYATPVLFANQVGSLSRQHLAWPCRILPARLCAALGLNNLVFKGCATVCDGVGEVAARAGAGAAGVAIARVELGQATNVELQRFGANPVVSGLSMINFRLVDFGALPLPSALACSRLLELLGRLSYRFSQQRRKAGRRAAGGAAGSWTDPDSLVILVPYVTAAALCSLLWQARLPLGLGARR